MSQDDTPEFRGGDFEIGRLHGRVAALEGRVDKQEGMLAQIDSKLDSVLLALASAVGGRERISSTMKWCLAIMSTVATVGGLILAALHFVAVGSPK